MSQIFRLLKLFEVWIYILLGLVGFYYLQKFVVALKEWRGTVFGLEKDNALRRINEAVTVLVLSILVAAGEFFLTTIVYSTVPGIQTLNTATLNVLASPSVTLAASPTNNQVNGVNTAVVTTSSIAPSLSPTAGQISNGCIKGKLEFTSPLSGDKVSGTVELKGVLVIDNFGFYKYEYSKSGSNIWITIAAGNEIKPDGSIGLWNVSLLVPGDYLLRLYVYDNKGQALQPCIISVTITTPPS
jgi:hypothetical protein